MQSFRLDFTVFKIEELENQYNYFKSAILFDDKLKIIGFLNQTQDKEKILLSAMMINDNTIYTSNHYFNNLFRELKPFPDDINNFIEKMRRTLQNIGVYYFGTQTSLVFDLN